MKIKKDNENVKEQAVNAAIEGMEEMDDEVMDQVSGGAGNPFANVSRVPMQDITEDVRGRV